MAARVIAHRYAHRHVYFRRGYAHMRTAHSARRAALLLGLTSSLIPHIPEPGAGVVVCLYSDADTLNSRAASVLGKLQIGLDYILRRRGCVRCDRVRGGRGADSCQHHRGRPLRVLARVRSPRGVFCFAFTGLSLDRAVTDSIAHTCCGTPLRQTPLRSHGLGSPAIPRPYRAQSGGRRARVRVRCQAKPKPCLALPCLAAAD